MKNVLSDEVVGFLNNSVLTTPGEYSLKIISINEAKRIAENCIIDSAVGHKNTSEYMTRLLGVKINFNRKHFVQQVGQKCLVFKLRDRPKEGAVLTIEGLKKIGYDFMLLVRKS